MKANCKNITKYVNHQMDRADCNNVSIGLPKLNKNTMTALQQNFKVARREFFGYVYFER